MSTPSLMYGEIDLMDANAGGKFAALVGSSWGAWQAITSTTASLFLDGSAVTGDATNNRSIVLKVEIQAATRAEIIAASELLIGEANRATNVLVFDAGDGTVPVVYETFRTAEPVRTDDESEAWTFREYTLTIPALPFARSNTRRDPFVTLTNVVIMPTTANLTGVQALTYSGFDPSGVDLATYTEGIPFKSAAGTGSDYASSAFSGLSVVSGCTLATVGAEKRITMTSTSAEVVSSASVAVSAAYLTVGVAWGDDTGTNDPTVTVGIEWFNGGTSIKVDWGSPRTKTAEGRTPSASFKRPASATAAKYRLKVAAPSGYKILVTYVQVEHLASSTQVPGAAYPGPFIGGSFIAAPSYRTTGSPANGRGRSGGYEYYALAAPVDASAQAALGLWLYRTPAVTAPGQTLATSSVTMRLHSGSTWSAWFYKPDAAENAAFAESTWRHPVFDPAVPDQISTGGAANLALIDAVSFDIHGVNPDDAPYQIGPVTAGPVPGSGSSPRGNLFVLDTISGSARSPAAVHAWSTTPLTDVIIQAVDPDDGPPLLTVTSNKATAAAPQQYQGVYSILGTRVPAGAPTTPTLTIVQKHAGVTVATSAAFPGTTRPGAHYVDFGAHALPLVAIPDENVSVSLEFTVSPSSSSWAEVLVLNTNSPLAMLENISPTAKNVFVDEPAIETGIGPMFIGNNTDRTDAYSPLTPPVLSLPFTVKAPSVELFVYSTAIGPNAGVEYYDRWLVEPA